MNQAWRCSTAVALGRICLALVASLVLAGCATTASRARVPNRTAYRGSVALSLVNDTQSRVCYVQMGPVSPDWGDDWLGRSEFIRPGAGRTFATRGGPAWQIRVQDCDRHTIRERTIALTARARLSTSTLLPTTLAAIQPSPQRYAGPIALTLVNDTAAYVYFVHMSPSSDGNWGDDWLGAEETIAPGAERTFMIVGADAWDLRVQGSDHTLLGTRRGMAIRETTRLNVSALSVAD